jgi:hypothetical protein
VRYGQGGKSSTGVIMPEKKISPKSRIMKRTNELKIRAKNIAKQNE